MAAHNCAPYPMELCSKANLPNVRSGLDSVIRRPPRSSPKESYVKEVRKHGCNSVYIRPATCPPSRGEVGKGQIEWKVLDLSN